MLKKIFKNLEIYDWEHLTQIYPSPNETNPSCICYHLKVRPNNKDEIQDVCAKVIQVSESHPELLEPQNQEKLMREIIIHSSLNHPAILRFAGFNMYESLKTRNDSISLSSPIILTQFMDRGSLQSLLQERPPKIWDEFAKQVCILHIAEGIRYLHSQGFLHLNLQPSTILFHADQNSDKLLPCISSFKYAHLIDMKNEPFEFDPNNKYLSPGFRNHDQKSTGEKADIYSFGLLMYTILTNNLVTDEITPERIKADLASIQTNEKLINFILKCLSPQPFEKEIREREESNIRANRKNQKDEPSGAIKEENEKLLIIEYIYEEMMNKDDLVICQADTDDLCLVKDEIFGGKRRLHFSEVFHVYPCSQNTLNLDDVIPGTVQPEDQLSDIISVLPNLTQSNEIKHIQLFNKLTQMAMTIINTPTSETESIRIANNFLQGAFGTYIGDNNSSPFNRSIIGDGAAAINLSPNIRVIPDGAFSGKDRMRCINLPMTLTQLGKRAFWNCTSLVWINLNIPGIKEIPEHCFECCESLQYIEFPQDLTHIRKHAFLRCSSLPKVELPRTLQHIGAKAFLYCKSLSIVSIPKTCTDIKRNAFPNFFKNNIRMYD